MINVKHRSELYKVADTNLPAVEVGCAEGYFSADLLRMGFTKLYMVDMWATIKTAKGDGASPQSWHDKNYQAAIKRVAKFGDKAVFLRGLSVEMAKFVPDNSVGLLYLDAGHDYDSVKEDLNAWYPKVVKGGIIAGHDYLNKSYGVKEAVHDFCRPKNIDVHLIPEHKDEDAGFYFVKP